MNKTEKLQYQMNIENYLEEHNVYDIFEGLMKSLIKEKPEDPIKHLIEKLEVEEPKRIIIMGPPGSLRKEYSLSLADYFALPACISVGDLLNKEINKKSEHGKKIAECRKSYSYVPDEVVMELVKRELQQYETEKKSWIMEGFPRTRVQALALQRMGIIPDKFIILEINNDETYNKIKSHLMNPEEKEGADQQRYLIDEAEEIAKNAVLEYQLNIKEVKEACSGFTCEVDANNQYYDNVLEDIARLIRLRIKPNAPRRPPRILICGPPGSGRSTQAAMVAKKYGLVPVSITNLLKAEISKKTQIGKVAAELMREGELVHDEMVMNLVEQRLKASDCKVNGWILDGFPMSEAQINLLKTLNIIPSLVIAFEIDDDIAKDRIVNKRIDPITGKEYNINTEGEKPQNLIQLAENNEEVVTKRLDAWKKFLPHMQVAYKDKIISMNVDTDPEAVNSKLCDFIENPQNV